MDSQGQRHWISTCRDCGAERARGSEIRSLVYLTCKYHGGVVCHGPASDEGTPKLTASAWEGSSYPWEFEMLHQGTRSQVQTDLPRDMTWLTLCHQSALP